MWLIYKIVLSVFTAVVGALFIMQVWRIFKAGGKGGYTVPVISARFAEISVPVYLWMVTVLVGGILSYIYPQNEGKPKVYVETKVQLQRLYGRVQGAEKLPTVKRHKKFRLTLQIVCGVLCIVSAAMVLWTLLSATYQPKLSGAFFTNHNAVADRLIFMLPWVLGTGVNAYLVCALSEKSRQQEVELLKAELVKQIKEGNVAQQSKEKEKSSDKLVLGLRVGFAVVAVILVIVGIFNGGMADVFKKAINICTQCIGMG